MTDLFLRLLSMSITAGWLVLAVCLFRVVFKNAPKFFRCILWAFVALRLVLPFSMESFLSLIPKTPSVTLGSEQLDIFGNAGNLVNNTPSVIPNNAEIPPVTGGESGVQSLLIISYVWLAGVICMLFYALFSYIKVKRGVSEAVRLQKNVYEGSVQTPFVLGLFRPKIYLPFGMDENERSFVIAHERGHIKRGDHWYKPIGFLLLSVYWFNPLMWIAFVLLCRDIELACDEKVIRQFGFEEKKDYSRALLSLSVSRRSISACPVAFGETSIKHRVKSVLNYKKPAFWIIIAAVIACAVITVCFLTDPKETNSDYIPGDRLSFYDTIEYDIDGDGNNETCSLGMGPTSGLFTFTFYAQKENSDVFYLNIFLSDWGKLSFEKSAFGNKLFVKLDGAENGGEERLYEVSVRDGDIVLSDPDGELEYWGPSGVQAKAFLEGAFIEETESGYVQPNNPSWGITLTAEDVTPIGMTLRLTQEGGELGKGEFITGQAYWIEVFYEGRWQSLIGDGTFTTEALVINPGGSYEWNLNWFHYYGYLESSFMSGLYRISKNVSFSQNSATDEEITETFYAYFEVPAPDGLELSQSIWAELDGDGENEGVKVTFIGDRTFTLEVTDNGKTVWERELSTYHTGWMAYYLYTDANKTYILEYNPYMSNGIAYYEYKLYLYDGEKMREKKSVSVSFDVNGKEHLPVDELAAFYEDINALLAKSIGIVSTLHGELSPEHSNADDDFWWLDDAEELYAGDETFTEKLQIYDEWRYNYYHS